MEFAFAAASIPFLSPLGLTRFLFAPFPYSMRLNLCQKQKWNIHLYSRILDLLNVPFPQPCRSAQGMKPELCCLPELLSNVSGASVCCRFLLLLLCTVSVSPFTVSICAPWVNNSLSVCRVLGLGGLEGRDQFCLQHCCMASMHSSAR